MSPLQLQVFPTGSTQSHCCSWEFLQDFHTRTWHAQIVVK
ncbi:G protein-coupled receptor 125 (predicted), isoform CRA_c [Rattus norvegicus]|uniref:G protein-coupled receptor 125 (Predicted), isoform CRA_c n=1 Tax=Rattus norvegicus TaxID=10116 RepID=A6IJJ5_RAT|nr:G protein-coupled receptor 125 (predicted), isoform CRA_c [Rattus norvegicus]